MNSVLNYYKARENLDLKCCCRLNVDQETLDQNKSSNLFDNNCDISFQFNLKDKFGKVI